MDKLPLLLGIMAVTLAFAAFNAWRQGNDRRDLIALDSLGGCFGLGTAVAALG